MAKSILPFIESDNSSIGVFDNPASEIDGEAFWFSGEGPLKAKGSEEVETRPLLCRCSVRGLAV